MSANVVERTRRRIVTGVVTSDKMDKTIKVTVQRDFKHPKYEKRIRRQTVYTAHDEANEAKTGDTVLIMGKGHEDYQEIRGVRTHFDDREVVREFFGQTRVLSF